MATSQADKRALNIPEYYFLTCLDHAGRLLLQQHTARTGLAGAVLTDLARRGNINVTQELVTVRATSENRLEPPLDSVVQIIHDAPERQDAEQWINRLASHTLLEAITEMLERRGAIKVRKKRLLGLISRTRYELQNSYSRMDMYVRLRATLLGRETALDSSTWALIQLLYSTNAVTRIFPGLSIRTVEQRLADFHNAAKETEPAITESLQAVKHAIAASLTATRGQATGMRG